MAKSKKRDVFDEMMEGVRAMRGHREGRVTLRSHRIAPLALPPIDEVIIRSTRERLHMSRNAFAHRLGVNPRTLERWEQGRSKPNDQAAALILLVRKYPDTLARLEAVAAS
jgi:putative transcriptional regulator